MVFLFESGATHRQKTNKLGATWLQKDHTSHSGSIAVVLVQGTRVHAAREAAHVTPQKSGIACPLPWPLGRTVKRGAKIESPRQERIARVTSGSVTQTNLQKGIPIEPLRVSLETDWRRIGARTDCASRPPSLGSGRSRSVSCAVNTRTRWNQRLLAGIRAQAQPASCHPLGERSPCGPRGKPRAGGWASGAARRPFAWGGAAASQGNWCRWPFWPCGRA